MLLVWRDMFNPDFGLINQLFGLDVNWFGDAAGRPGSRSCSSALAGLPVHVPGLHRRAAGDPGGPDRGGRGRRRQAVPGVPHGHVPAAAGAVAPLLIASFAFNFNNFSAIYLTTRGRPVPAGQPAGRRHRPARSATPTGWPSAAPARSTASPRRSRSSSSSSSRSSRSSASAAPRHSRRSTDDRASGETPAGSLDIAGTTAPTSRTSSTSAAPRAAGSARSAGGTWSASSRCVFALFPILFVVSAAFNPLGTLSSSALIPTDAEPRELPATLFDDDRLRRLVPQLASIIGCSPRPSSMFISRLRGLRVLPLPVQRPPARAARPAADPDVPAVPGDRGDLPDVHDDHATSTRRSASTPRGR